MQNLWQHKISRCVSIIIKPLRIFQFFAVLLLLSFTIYMIVMDQMPISALACILLIVLSGVYVFVLAVELISHFAGGALHVIPMAIFSFIGLLFFGVAGILFIFYDYTQHVVTIMTMATCLLIALLFLIDITMVLAFWKRRCTVCKRCCNDNATEPLSHRNEEPRESNTPENKIMKRDVTTSLSEIRVPHELKNIVTPDHCYRKVQYPRRREYVDCTTCVPSLCNLDDAQIQTETKKVSVMESQTPRANTKETPMQTLSKCEFCHQQIQFPIAEGAGVPNAHYFQQSSQWGYPAIVQFARGAPCCPGCKCATDTDTTQQQPQELKKQRVESLTRKVKSNPISKTLTSETTQQVANTENGNDDNVKRLMPMQPITAYTEASFYGPGKRMQAITDIAKQKMDATKIKENAKPTSEDVDQKIAGKTIMKIMKTKNPETVEEAIFEHDNVKKGNENSAESEEKTIAIDEKIERTKGGGEPSTRIYEEFMRATEQGSMTNLEESSMSGTLITGCRTKPRTLLLHMKSNKVDPIKDANIFDEDCTLEKTEWRTALDDQADQKSEHPARIESPNPATEYQLNDACSLCRRRKSLTPTSDSSRCYVVFKNKRGKNFCEFCAPLDSKKITSRLEGTDLRKLRCTNCRLHLRDRGRTNVKSKSDVCPKCGRSQRYAASPAST